MADKTHAVLYAIQIHNEFYVVSAYKDSQDIRQARLFISEEDAKQYIKHHYLSDVKIVDFVKIVYEQIRNNKV